MTPKTPPLRDCFYLTFEAALPQFNNPDWMITWHFKIYVCNWHTLYPFPNGNKEEQHEKSSTSVGNLGLLRTVQ